MHTTNETITKLDAARRKARDLEAAFGDGSARWADVTAAQVAERQAELLHDAAMRAEREAEAERQRAERAAVEKAIAEHDAAIDAYGAAAAVIVADFCKALAAAAEVDARLVDLTDRAQHALALRNEAAESISLPIVHRPDVDADRVRFASVPIVAEALGGIDAGRVLTRWIRGTY